MAVLPPSFAAHLSAISWHFHSWLADWSGGGGSDRDLKFSFKHSFSCSEVQIFVMNYDAAGKRGSTSMSSSTLKCGKNVPFELHFI